MQDCRVQVTEQSLTATAMEGQCFMINATEKWKEIYFAFSHIVYGPTYRTSGKRKRYEALNLKYLSLQTNQNMTNGL